MELYVKVCFWNFAKIQAQLKREHFYMSLNLFFFYFNIFSSAACIKSQDEESDTNL